MGAAALLGLAEQDPALSLRRLRPVPPALAPDPADLRTPRPLTGRRRGVPLHHLEHSQPSALKGGRLRTLAPVEIRHVKPGKSFFGGYKKRAIDDLLDEIAASYEDVWRERADLADKATNGAASEVPASDPPADTAAEEVAPKE